MIFSRFSSHNEGIKNTLFPYPRKPLKIKADEIALQYGRLCSSKWAILNFKMGDFEIEHHRPSKKHP